MSFATAYADAYDVVGGEVPPEPPGPSVFGAARWSDYAAIAIEAELGAGGLVLDAMDGTGTLDFNALEGVEGSWVDITCDVIECEFTTGATRAEGPLTRDEAGSCRLRLDNTHGHYDPTDTMGPYAPGGYSRVRPMIGVRVRAAQRLASGDPGLTHALWTGFADEWEISWRPGEPSEAILNASDAIKVLSNSQRPPLPTPVGAGETVYNRVDRILDAVAWPDADRSLTGTLGPTCSGTLLNEAAWTELLRTIDYELGLLYVAGDGKVSYSSRQALVDNAASAPVWLTLGCEAGEFTYRDATIAYDDTTLRNDVAAGGEGRTTQYVRDENSIATYRERHYERTDLPAFTDAMLLDWANYLLAFSAYPEMRIDDVAWSPLEAGDDAAIRDAFDALFQTDRLRKVQVRAERPWAEGDPYIDNLFVRGWQHTITQDDWQARWITVSARLYDFLILDDATEGVLDEMRLSP